MMDNKPVIEVAAALIAHEGKVLLAKRHQSDEQGGLWEFPGGGREEGEELRECLRRELREELGIEVQVGDEVAAISHDYGKFVVQLHLFCVHITRGDPKPLGCAEVRWFQVNELQDLPLAPADRELLVILWERKPRL